VAGFNVDQKRNLKTPVKTRTLHLSEPYSRSATRNRHVARVSKDGNVARIRYSRGAREAIATIVKVAGICVEQAYPRMVIHLTSDEGVWDSCQSTPHDTHIRAPDKSSLRNILTSNLINTYG
jgi:hypothetical protein